MQSRAVIKVKDLQHMMAVIGLPEIIGTNITALEDLSEYNENGSNNIIHQEPSGEKELRTSDNSMGIILLSLSVIHNSTHRLLIKMNKKYDYEFRNIYMAQEGIVVVDKRNHMDNVRFTIVPFITFAIGAVSGIGKGKTDLEVEDSFTDPGYMITVVEQTPDSEEKYKTRCLINKEPEEIERIVKFLAYTHQACLKGAVKYE